MPKAILTLNAGSSSIKFALYELATAGPQRRLSHGQVEGIGGAPHFIANDPAGTTLTEHPWPAGANFDHETLLALLLTWITTHLGEESLAAVGHRVMHGGEHWDQPVRLTPAVIASLTTFTSLAHLHQPHNRAGRVAVASATAANSLFRHRIPSLHGADGQAAGPAAQVRGRRRAALRLSRIVV